jgi:hypothetical protein
MQEKKLLSNPMLKLQLFIFRPQAIGIKPVDLMASPGPGLCIMPQYLSFGVLFI